jgi:hypothetical protein
VHAVDIVLVVGVVVVVVVVVATPHLLHTLGPLYIHLFKETFS